MAKLEYRVILKDKVDGKEFTFSIKVKAKGLLETEKKVTEEFPEASIVKIEQVIADDLGPFA